jgi:pimeloyl-ACP methyl ester carboxylesterase
MSTARGRATGVGAMVAAALLACSLAACTGSARGGAGHPTSSPAGAVTTALHWRSCQKAADGAPDGSRLLCAMLQVPLSYQNPDGRKISLALSEIPAAAPPDQQQGALLVNPGGPGAPGLGLAAQVAAALRPSVAADYDIIGFDTRGVGASVPALSCDASFFARPRPPYVPASGAAEQALVDRARGYAADCEQKFGWLLPYMTTQDLARDMNSIRVALGQQQISFLGYSYGTYLGQVYATMFPKHVRRMVLDSVVDPDGVWWADNIAQDYAFQGRMDAFFAWTAEGDDVFHLGSTAAQVRASFAEASARLGARPIDGPAGPLVGPDELSDTFLAGAYNNSFWPDLAASLSYYLHGGNTSDLLAVYQAIGGQNENGFAVYNAVECSDASWPRSWAYWNADTRKVYARAPYETWANAWFNAACAFWPVTGPATPMRIDGHGLPPILMLQGTLDAATPYQGALAARRALPSARMVVVVGGGNHGQSLSSPANPCVLGYLNRYLADGTLPSSSALVSATCPALPPPAA